MTHPILSKTVTHPSQPGTGTVNGLCVCGCTAKVWFRESVEQVELPVADIQVVLPVCGRGGA